uniref:Uncharacterized protein n=1 Tax=Aegilops tauschii subsp. strangulata TaxID=200361 RepID=A0A453HZ08_AEGTS
MQRQDKKQEKDTVYEKDRKREKGGPLGGRMSHRIQADTVGDEDDLPGCLARGQPRCEEKQRRQHPHNRCGSKLAPGDETHAHIASKDANDDDTIKICKLASSMAQLLIEPYYPSVAVDRPERSRRRTASQTRLTPWSHQ